MMVFTLLWLDSLALLTKWASIPVFLQYDMSLRADALSPPFGFLQQCHLIAQSPELPLGDVDSLTEGLAAPEASPMALHVPVCEHTSVPCMRAPPWWSFHTHLNFCFTPFSPYCSWGEGLEYLPCNLVHPSEGIQVVLAVWACEDGVLGVPGVGGAGGHEGFNRGFCTDAGSWSVPVMVALVLEMVVG